MLDDNGDLSALTEFESEKLFKFWALRWLHWALDSYSKFGGSCSIEGAYPSINFNYAKS